MAKKHLELCRKVFVEKNTWDDECDDQLMMASYAGGMSIAYSQVGVATCRKLWLKLFIRNQAWHRKLYCHESSRGVLSGRRKRIKHMVAKNNIDIPVGICANLSEEQFDAMINVSLGMKPLWENALGPNWESIMTREKLRALFGKL